MQAAAPNPRVPWEAQAHLRRVRTDNPSTSAIVLGPADPVDPSWYDSRVYSWAYRAARSGQACSDQVARIAVALVRNAHQHTRSGSPRGTVEVTVTRDRFQVQVTVTDNGADQGADGWYPFPRARPHGGGLRLVERLSLYWDWAGGAGLPITVRALVDR